MKRIFQLAAAGYGYTGICKQLDKERYQPFGSRETYIDEHDGKEHKRAGNGQDYGCGTWMRAYVGLILTDKRAIGQYQPKTVNGHKPDPIANYYPAVVTEAEWNAAAVALSSRRLLPGSPGKEQVNLFRGLVFDARTGSRYDAYSRIDHGKHHRVLVRSNAAESGHGSLDSFPLETFERAVLHLMTELHPNVILPDEPKPEDAEKLDAELNALAIRRKMLADELLKGDVPEVVEAIKMIRDREQQLQEELKSIRTEQARPLSDALDEARTLIGILDNSEDKQDTRLRLRAAISRLIGNGKIYLLVWRKGAIRIADVQIQFGSGSWRDLLVVHKPVPSGPLGNRIKLGMWFAISIDSGTVQAQGGKDRGSVPPLADYQVNKEVAAWFEDRIERQWPAIQKVVAAGTVVEEVDTTWGPLVVTGIVK